MVIAQVGLAKAESTLTAASATPQVTGEQKWVMSIESYKIRYKLTNASEKRVNNKGGGDENLYGVRNFRAVLHGVLYRGGANNTENKLEKRENNNPLQKNGLENLCKEGFSKAIYFYSKNNEKMQPTTSCETSSGKSNTLDYVQISALNFDNSEKLLKIIYEQIISQNSKPIYAHCWNGWHASGFISAISLMQFCGIDNKSALEYWIKNTDGNNKGYEKIKSRILAFKSIPALQISKDLQEKICPDLGLR